MNDFNAGAVSARDRLNGRWAVGAFLVLSRGLPSARRPCFIEARRRTRRTSSSAGSCSPSPFRSSLMRPRLGRAATGGSTTRSVRLPVMGRIVAGSRGTGCRHGNSRRGRLRDRRCRRGPRRARRNDLAPALGRGRPRPGSAALGGLAYTSFFAFGSLSAAAAAGRLLAFLLDAGACASTSIGALPWPRAHLRSLIGGELVCGLAERQSAAVLASMPSFSGRPVSCVSDA